VANARAFTQFVGFRLDEQEYAFRIEQIQEIVIPDHVTRVPQVPDYVEGVSNLRGTIIPIINLRRLFDFDLKPRDEDTRTIVTNVGARTIGCTVDAVTQVIRILPEQIQGVPENMRSEGAICIEGFAKLESRLIILLNIDALLDPAKMEHLRQIVGRRSALSGSD
jgi:purine-binding chemotaxis protein CheW